MALIASDYGIMCSLRIKCPRSPRVVRPPGTRGKLEIDLNLSGKPAGGGGAAKPVGGTAGGWSWASISRWVCAFLSQAFLFTDHMRNRPLRPLPPQPVIACLTARKAAAAAVGETAISLAPPPYAY